MSGRQKALRVNTASLVLLAVSSSFQANAQTKPGDDYATCQQTEDVEKSISACTRIVDDKSVESDDRALMYLRRGYGYFTLGDTERALLDYTRSIELRPKNVFAYANRAVVYERMGDRTRALEDVRTARALDGSQFASLVQASAELTALSKPAEVSPPPVVEASRQTTKVEADVSDRRASVWDHNGSSVKLLADGASRKFQYLTPRAGMLQAGARPGAIVFSGQRKGKSYSGKAFVFSRLCGPTSYDVQGDVSGDERTVTLYGRVPRRDNSCNVKSYADDVLVFVYTPSKQ